MPLAIGTHILSCDTLLRVRTLLALAAVPFLLRADTYPRQPGVDVLHYSIQLSLGDGADEISGETAIRVRFIQANVREVTFDLAALTDGRGMSVSSIAMSGRPLPFTHRPDNKLVITLPAAPEVQSRVEFVVRYQGSPRIFKPAKGLSIAQNRHGDRTFYALNWPDGAREWFPCIDHPYEKATSEMRVTAPSRYQVVSNGLLQEETDLGNGTRVTHWKQSVPISTWLITLGVAQFAVKHYGPATGIPLETWVAWQDRHQAAVTFELPARRAIAFFSEFVGPYPYERLANIIAAGLSGGTEHASAIFYGERTIADRPATNLVAHEIAHQWFGDSVTESDWDDVWLSEGFATYFTLLYTEHYAGRDAFVEGLNRSRRTVLEAEKKMPGQPVIHNNLSDMRRVLNQLVYQKGGWVLHMLRELTGRDAFQQGIREYYKHYRDANASTDQFRRVMEEASGQELRWFFDQWLKRAGSPVLEVKWRWDAGARQVTGEIVQSQPGDPYRLQVELSSEKGQVQKIDLTAKTQRFSYASESDPGELKLDPNTNLLFEGKIVRERQ